MSSYIDNKLNVGMFVSSLFDMLKYYSIASSSGVIIIELLSYSEKNALRYVASTGYVKRCQNVRTPGNLGYSDSTRRHDRGRMWPSTRTRLGWFISCNM